VPMYGRVRAAVPHANRAKANRETARRCVKQLRGACQREDPHGTGLPGAAAVLPTRTDHLARVSSGTKPRPRRSNGALGGVPADDLQAGTVGSTRR